MKQGQSIGMIAESGNQAQFVKSHPWDMHQDDELRMNPIIPYFDPQQNKIIIPRTSK